MAKTANDTSNLDPHFWSIGKGGLYKTSQPIYVGSLGGSSQAWFAVGAENLPTEKQLAAWENFCKISPMRLKEVISEGLARLLQQMDRLPANAKPQYGPSYQPIVVSRNTKRTIEAMSKNDKPLGGQARFAFQCNSIVIPKQDEAPVRFIIINFQIGRKQYEFEAVVCNEAILWVGENSGLWTRIEWDYDYNVPDFNPKTALHPYW